MDREKVIKAYEDFVNGYECFCTSDDCEYEMHKAVLSMLKEQEDELTNEEALRFIEKLKSDNNELREKYSALLKEQEAVVRCKDCRHYNIIGCAGGFGWCERYDVGHTDEWFCADGKKGKK